MYDHVADGRMSILENWVFGVIASYADPATGVWVGSAQELSQRFPLSDRTCRFLLTGLEQKGYIKRFQTPGKNGPYPILVDKYECSIAAGRGKRLNAAQSTSSKHVAYDYCRDAPAPTAAATAALLIEKSLEKKAARARVSTPIPRNGIGPHRPFDPSTVAPPLTPEEEAKVMEYFSQQELKKKPPSRSNGSSLPASATAG